MSDWLVERLENLAMDISNNEPFDFVDEAAQIRRYVAKDLQK